MVKTQKKDLDAAQVAPKRKSSYQAPSVQSSVRHKKEVPSEYRSFKKAPKSYGFLVFFLFLLFVATLGGFIYWNQRFSQTKTESLELSVQGPEKIVSGDEVTYKLEYKNLDKVALTQMELSVYWPAGFYFDSSSINPSNQNATEWLLSDLPAGQTATLEIKGQLVGNKEENLEAAFTLDYQPANFSSNFSVKKTTSTLITDNKLELKIEAVEKTLINTEQEIKIVYKNLSQDKIEDLFLDVLFPDDWANTKIEPTWEGELLATSLEAAEEKTILITGNFGADTKPEQALVVEIGKKQEEKFRRLARAEKKINVISPKFESILKINGQSTDLQANWGDELLYQLEVKNISASDINDAQVAILLNGELLDWDTIDTSAEIVDESIVWNKDQDEAMAVWPSQETKTFTWKIKVVKDPVSERLMENILQINVLGLADWEQVINLSKLAVGENLTFNSGVYWDLGGRRVGSGLLPPKVDEETNYLAVWSIPQAVGDFNNVKVTTVLPPQVAFVDETDVSVGNLTFDETSKSLVWTIDNFETSLMPATASFVLQIIPEAADQGKAMTLLNTVTASAIGAEEVVVKTKILKTTDVVAESSEPVGLVQ